MGLGVQGGGVGVARFFARHGAVVTVTDLRTEKELQPSMEKLQKWGNKEMRNGEIRYVLGRHELADFTSADLVIKGPSVRWDNVYITAAIRAGVQVSMETALCMRYTPARIIGVTGTRGKSTTTMMIHAALKQTLGSHLHLAGNLPGCSTIELLDQTQKDDVILLELSSWQLSGCHREKVSPHIAVFTNLYADHLNYYDDMEDYFQDKTAIYRYQREGEPVFFSDSIDPKYKTLIQQERPDAIFVPQSDYTGRLTHLAGTHNLQNAALAYTVSKHILKQKVVHEDILKNITDYPGLPCRQESIFSSPKITVINDTTSTTPVATITALEAFSEDQIILILGGNSKKLPLDDLLESLITHQRHIIKVVLLAGSMTTELLPAVQSMREISCSPVYVDFAAAIRDAVETAGRSSSPCIILFSPGATSFAQFKNEFERGEQFNTLIRSMLSE